MEAPQPILHNPQPEQPIQLLELNDHCLLQILENLYAAEDLSAVALTCTRLRAIARKVYKCYRRDVVLHKDMTHPTTQQFVGILRNFGDMITSITIALAENVPDEPNQTYTNLFNAMAKYCADTPIDSLFLSRFTNLIVE